MVCNICEKEIEKGHRYLGYIPKGYGKNKLMDTEGIMHVVHLSSTDWLRLRSFKA